MKRRLTGTRTIRMHNQEQPLISVCIVNYNQSRFFNDCLNSCLNQTYPNLELIIIDDASTDNSVAIIKQLIEPVTKNLSFIENKTNQGICKNLNAAVSIAKGEYISIVASDDYFEFDRFDKMLKALQSSGNEYKVAYSNTKTVDSTGNVLKEDFIRFIRPDIDVMPDGDIFPELIKGNFIPAIGMLIKKDVFAETGLFDETLKLEDYDMWLRIAARYKFRYVDSVSYYRQLETSLMRSLEKRPAYYKEHFMTLYKHVKTRNTAARKNILGQLFNLFKAHTKRNKRFDFALFVLLAKAILKL